MKTSSLTEPHRKFNKILIRYSCQKEYKANEEPQHPEKSHLLKYFPKYYSHLTLEVARQNPLLSKIKRIKKLQKFTGALKKKIPISLLRALLGNNKKNIEEIPQIISESRQFWLDDPFWARLTEWKVKFFPNIAKLVLPKRKTDDHRIEDFDDFLGSRRFLMKKDMRRLKILELFLRDAKNEGVKWMLEKLDGMGKKFFDRLDVLRMQIDDESMNIQELFKNKNLFANLTGLRFSFNLMKFDPSLMKIPETCNKLRSLSMGFEPSLDQDPEFPNFLTGLQSLPRLTDLEFFWSESAKAFWSNFKPKASLRSLKLGFNVTDLKESSTSATLLQDLLGHWEDIDEMDEIEFTLSFYYIEDLPWVKMFMTMVLVKVRKLCSFKCLIETCLYNGGGEIPFEPFFLEQVPHLYESLRKFELSFKNSQCCREIGFDLKKMKVFKNLKELKLEGKRIFYKNIDEMVTLMEQKEGDNPLLELKLELEGGSKWFREIMEKIYKAKRSDRNLKIMINLSFWLDYLNRGELEFLGELCDSMKSVGLIKGLFVSFVFVNVKNVWPFEAEKLREVVSKYGGIRNFMVRMWFISHNLEYIVMKGENKQLLLKNGKIVL